VEDDRALCRALAAALEVLGFEHRLCRSLRDARDQLTHLEGGWKPDLVLLDVVLPDGTALDFLRAFSPEAPLPVIVAMSGSAEPAQAFELATLGVRRFLPKPVELERLGAVLSAACDDAPPIRAHVKALVGARALSDVEEEVRTTMVAEAVARAGSVRGAARLLDVSRQLLQHILRRAEGASRPSTTESSRSSGS
jgi:DNA-binding response OmpR family regulator